MIGFLVKLLAPWKSELFALVGVLAVAGIGTAAISYFYSRAQAKTIELQDKTIELQATTNQQWAQNWRQMEERRKQDQQAVLDLQEQLRLITEGNDKMAADIKDLEKNSAEVKEFLGRRIPPDLRRLLQRQ